jgi:hypothetical protein
MNRIAMTAAAAALCAGPALAYTGVSPTIAAEVDQILLSQGFNDVEPTSLTDQQVIEIYLLSQNDNEGDIRQSIATTIEGDGLARSYTETAPAMAERGVMIEEGENSVARTVGNWLQSEGLIAADETVALTDRQVAELYFIAFGSMSEGEKSEAARRVLEM